jgi:TetR/AcrR family transcriptional regulator
VINYTSEQYTFRYVYDVDMGGTEHETPARILQHALTLFSENGYAGTSVREICDAAGITKPTLYYFFGSKEGLYRAAVDGALEKFRNDMPDLLAKGGTVQEKLERVAWNHFKNVREQKDLMRFIFSLVHGRPSHAPATDFVGFYMDICRLLGQMLDDAVRCGELLPGDTQLRVLVFVGSLSEALGGYVLSGSPDLTPTLAHDLVDTILHSWSPS